MTFPQIMLYLEALAERKQMEMEAFQQADEPGSFGSSTSAVMRKSDLIDFGIKWLSK